MSMFSQRMSSRDREGASAAIVATIQAELSRLSIATTPTVRALRRTYSRALAAEPPDLILAVADTLLTDGWSERLVACELLVEHPSALGRVTPAMIEKWVKPLSDWGSVDLFGVTVAGVAWREGRLSDAHVRRWSRSPNRWRRRLALVATVPLNSAARGGAGDAARTLAICSALVRDRDDLVVKALSWALRELWKREPARVATFMRREDARLASRVRREVRTKMETGRKAVD